MLCQLKDQSRYSILEIFSICINGILFSEFVPYIFQILSMLIELQQNELTCYMALFPHLLVPVLWERPGNIPPLVRLLQAIIEKGSKHIEPEKLVKKEKKFSLLR